MFSANVAPTWAISEPAQIVRAQVLAANVFRGLLEDVFVEHAIIQVASTPGGFEQQRFRITRHVPG
jgi:hypothetical protein